MIRSIRARLLFAGIVLIALALALVWVILSNLFAMHIAREYEKQLVAVIDTLAANLSVRDGMPVLGSEPSDPRYSIPASGFYWQVSGGADKLLRSRSLWDQELSNGIAVDIPGASLHSAEGPDGQPLLAEIETIEVEGPQPAPQFTIAAAIDRSDFDMANAQFSSSLASMLAITGFMLAGAAALQVYLGLLPLARLRSDLNVVRSGAAPRMPDRGPVETHQLVSEINDLLETRDNAIEKARNRASDLAHGLKTPLTALAQVADSLPSSVASTQGREMHEQIAVIRQRIDRQLALARLGADRKSAMPVSECIEKLLVIMRKLSVGQGLQWESRLQPGLMVACDQTDFSEALGNILDNARKFASSRVLISAERDASAVVVRIEDDGPGIPQERYSEALDRGVRLDQKAGESGLGLAIAGDILLAHGGAVGLGRSGLGGLLVSLSWPAAQLP
ncbi:MAG: HAMP domain-containing sensor histidine kinase [Nitratireductor sp.]